MTIKYSFHIFVGFHVTFVLNIILVHCYRYFSINLSENPSVLREVFYKKTPKRANRSQLKALTQSFEQILVSIMISCETFKSYKKLLIDLKKCQHNPLSKF